MEPGRKIMVVDDQPDTIAFLSAWLADHDCDCCTEMESSKAIATALRERPSLILLDVNMPGISGIEVYRALRETEPLKEIPVIFVTGAGQVELFGHGCSMLPEPAGRVEKPFDLAMLGEAISKVLNGGLHG